MTNERFGVGLLLVLGAFALFWLLLEGDPEQPSPAPESLATAPGPAADGSDGPEGPAPRGDRRWTQSKAEPAERSRLPGEDPIPASSARFRFARALRALFNRQLGA